MRHGIFLATLFTALLLAACGEQTGTEQARDQQAATEQSDAGAEQGTASASSAAEEAGDEAGQAADGQAELGDWGVDLSAMKESVDPGDDFFRYANGTWLEDFEIPEDQVRWGSFMKLRERSQEQVKAILEEMAAAEHDKGTVRQKVGDYYASFMDVDAVNQKGLEPLRPMLDEIATISSHEDVVTWFGQADQRDVTTPISSGIGIDRKNPDRYMLNIGHSGLGLPDRSYYLEDTERFKKIRKAYRKHIAEMLGVAGIEEPEAKAEAIYEVEKAIAQEHWPREELRNRDKTYNVYKLAELSSEFANFDWARFLEAAKIPTSELDELNVRTPDAIEPLAQIVNDTPVSTWKAYLAFHALRNHAEFLSQDIYDKHFAFYGKTLNGQPQQKPRWKRAVDEVASARGGLGEAVGRIYVDRHFPPSAKQQMEQLVENLRKAFRVRLERLDWMGEETKKEAFEKLETFNPKIGYPDEWRDFSDLEIVAGDLMANVRAVRDYFYQDMVDRLTEPADKDEWFMAPQTVNAYYNPSWNEIVFPAAILQPPFFDPNADPAVNYGGIGAVIGHEMGHGFDDQGSKSDAEGIQRNWWTDADRKRFEKRTQALVEQYDQYSPIEGETVNGQLTLGENIGDLGGLSIALEAYEISLDGEKPAVKDGFTGRQRFFLGWAQVWQGKSREEYMLRRLKSDPHSPAEFRVNGVVRNMDAWYDAFDVEKKGDLFLSGEKRVSIW